MAKKRPSGWDVVAAFFGGFASPEHRQRQEIERLRDDVSYYRTLYEVQKTTEMLQDIRRAALITDIEEIKKLGE